MQDKEATQGLLNQDVELDGSYDWREEENEKTTDQDEKKKRGGNKLCVFVDGVVELGVTKCVFTRHGCLLTRFDSIIVVVVFFFSEWRGTTTP